MNILVSVIITCHNYAQYLEEAVESVFARCKETPPIEVVIVDDASMDHTISIIANLVKLHPEIYVYRTAKNIKTSAARNMGVKLSHGNFLVMLDADDKFPKNYIYECMKCLQENKVDVVYNNSRHFGGSLTVEDWPEFDVNVLRTRNYIHCSALMKKEVWDKVKGFDENMLVGNEDYDFWLSAAKEGFKFKKCWKTELWYRIKPDSRNALLGTKYREQTRTYLQCKHGVWYKG